MKKNISVTGASDYWWWTRGPGTASGWKWGVCHSGCEYIHTPGSWDHRCVALCCRSALQGTGNGTRLELRSADQQQDAVPGAQRISIGYRETTVIHIRVVWPREIRRKRWLFAEKISVNILLICRIIHSFAGKNTRLCIYIKEMIGGSFMLGKHIVICLVKSSFLGSS